ncbi:MAG: glycosyltransferase family 39 protein, partial [Trebonia sp.]
MRITRERMPWPLLAVLAVQTALSVSMVRARTAFGDEALYLNAGHLEWAHWLHGTQIPDYQTWFSGAPVIYPPIGAIADSLGGLTAARLLSLVFMLGVTSLVWCTATRLLRDERAAFFAAALFAVLAPTLHLGSFATFDALALLLLAAATWCAAGARSGHHAARWLIAAGILLALANATKYATALYDPTVLCVAFLSSWPDAGWQVALRRAA